MIDHFLNEAKKKTVYNSLVDLDKRIALYYEYYIHGISIPPFLKLTIVTVDKDIQYIPDLLSIDELIFEKFIQENIFSFVNKKNFIDPQEFPQYMVCFEEVFEKSYDQNTAVLNRIKNDPDINYLINNIRNVFYKMGDELNKKIEELTINMGTGAQMSGDERESFNELKAQYEETKKLYEDMEKTFEQKLAEAKKEAKELGLEKVDINKPHLVV